MAGWQDYGFYPGGICTMAQQWVAVEGLAAAFNERVALFEDTGYRKHFVKFDISKYSTPGIAFLELAKEFFKDVFFHTYRFDRKFRDSYAWCVDDPLSVDFVSKTQFEQRDLALAWLGNFFGFDAPDDPGAVATNLFKFRPWGEACRNLYLLINNWRYHYELADCIRFTRANYEDYERDKTTELYRKAFEAGESSGWSDYSFTRFRVLKDDIISQINVGAIVFHIIGRLYNYYCCCTVDWLPRGAGFCAREDLPDLADCAAGYIAIMGECRDWASMSAACPPGTILSGRAQPGVECYSPFANWSFVPEPDRFETGSAIAECTFPLVCYDLAPKLSFYRSEDRIVKN